MRTEVYWIADPWSGRLGIIPRPRGGDWLEDEVLSWQDSGFDVIVSLLMQEEIMEFDLEHEKELCQAHGIQFRSFPIPDRGVPLSREAFIDLIYGLEKDLETGKSIVVHCRQGIGRSILIAGSLLISTGQEPEAVLAQISTARGCSVPDTDEQRNWIIEFASSLSSAP